MTKVAERKQITREMRKKYIDQGGANCPFCGSPNIEGGEYEGEGSQVWSTITCNECGEQWDDVYKLIGCEEVI